MSKLPTSANKNSCMASASSAAVTPLHNPDTVDPTESDVPLRSIVSSGGGEKLPFTPLQMLLKSLQFMDTFYAGWRNGLQNSPMIPAFFYKKNGFWEPTDPAVSGYNPPKNKRTDKSEVPSQEFEREWFSFLVSAANKWKDVYKKWPYLVLWQGEYSKFAQGKVPAEFTEFLQRSNIAVPERESLMVDFVLFMPEFAGFNANTIVLIECKSAKSKQGRSGSKQLAKAAEFLQAVNQYLLHRGRLDNVYESSCQTSPSQRLLKIVRIVAEDCERKLGFDDSGCSESADAFGQTFHFDRRVLNYQAAFIAWVLEKAAAAPGGSGDVGCASLFHDVMALIIAQQNIITGSVVSEMLDEMKTQRFLKNPHTRQKTSGERGIEETAELSKEMPSSQLFQAAIRSQLFYLSPRQKEVLLDDSQRVELRGPPGTGKTLILLLKAVLWYDKGNNRDIICVARDGLLSGYRQHFVNFGFISTGVFSNVEVLQKSNCENRIMLFRETHCRDYLWQNVIAAICRGRMVYWVADDCLMRSALDIISTTAPFWFVLSRNTTDSTNNIHKLNHLPPSFKAIVLVDVFRYTSQVFEQLRNMIPSFHDARLAHCVQGPTPPVSFFKFHGRKRVDFFYFDKEEPFDFERNIYCKGDLMLFLRHHIAQMIEEVCLTSPANHEASGTYNYRNLAICCGATSNASFWVDYFNKEIAGICASLNAKAKSFECSDVTAENAITIDSWQNLVGLEFAGIIHVQLSEVGLFEDIKSDEIRCFASRAHSHIRVLSIFINSYSLFQIPLDDSRRYAVASRRKGEPQQRRCHIL